MLHRPFSFKTRQILPLIIIVLIIAGVAWVGFQIYLSVNKIRATATERMGNKNVVFSKDGLRVGVKQVGEEKYVDSTQKWVVKAWNLANEDRTRDNK